MFSDILIYFQATSKATILATNTPTTALSGITAFFFFFITLSYLKEQQSEPVVISSGFKINTEHIKCVKKINKKFQ